MQWVIWRSLFLGKYGFKLKYLLGTNNAITDEFYPVPRSLEDEILYNKYKNELVSEESYDIELDSTQLIDFFWNTLCSKMRIRIYAL